MERLVPRVKNLDVIDAPPESVDNTCRSIRLISPRGHEFEFSFGAYILDRHIFESHLGDIARSHGAHIDIGVQAHFFPDDQGGWVGPTRENRFTARLSSQQMVIRARPRREPAFEKGPTRVPMRSPL